MNEIEKSNRRVEMSAVLSDAVYDYEQDYTGGGYNPIGEAKAVLNKAGIDEDSYEIVDSMYDRGSGVAAIAVYDKLTKETYISYAGTNMGADGHKDPIVDLAIALNDTLYLKEKTNLPLIFMIEWRRVDTILAQLLAILMENIRLEGQPWRDKCPIILAIKGLLSR